MSRRSKKQSPPKIASRGGRKVPPPGAAQEARGAAATCLTGSALKEHPVARNWEVTGICALLLSMVFLVFGQTFRFDFVNFDDDRNVYVNPAIKPGFTLHGIATVFSRNPADYWHPLTFLTHMLDCQLYGLHAGGHHFTNVLLHAAAAVLLFLTLRRITAAFWRSSFVAAVFAIHPLHVESVAWISERKDMLSAVFFLLTIGAYFRYACARWSLWRYLTILALFALGLMSKPTLMPLPFLLLVFDYWPLRRFPQAAQAAYGNGGRAAAGPRVLNIPLRLIAEKLPLLVLSIGSCIEAATGNNGAFHRTPPVLQFENVLVSYAAYVRQTIWPVGLAVFYPFPTLGLPLWRVLLAAVVLIVMSLVVFAWRKQDRWPLVGWLWYLGMLTPMIGFIQAGDFARADRYTYLPQIGLCIMATWAAGDWAGRRQNRQVALGAVASALLAALSVAAWQQTAYWRDSAALWNRALACTHDNFVAQNSLGVVRLDQGRIEEAIPEFREALRINPAYTLAHTNLGNALLRQDKTEEAISQFREALRIDHTHVDTLDTLNNLGTALLQQGRTEEASAQFREALRLDPTHLDTLNNIGNALLHQGRVEEAIAQFREALRINPTDPDILNNLGNSLLHHGQTDEAIARFREALRLNPSSQLFHYNLGDGLLRQERLEDAIAEFREALQIDPNFADAHNNLGNSLFQQGRTGEATAEFREALRAKPAYADAHNNLGRSLLQQGQTEEAIAEYREALRINPAYADAHYNLGNVFFQQDRTEEAVAEYREAVRINPDYADAHGDLGDALLRQGRIEEAIAQTEKALDLQPANLAIQANLAWMLATASKISLRDGPKALDLASKVNQLTGGNNPSVARTLAAAYAAAGDFSKAVQTAQNALQLAETQPETGLANALRREIKLYEAGHPFENTR